jgi:hypothetical protein
LDQQEVAWCAQSVPQQAQPNVPDVQIELIDAGYLVSVEQPDYVNARIYEFLEQR